MSSVDRIRAARRFSATEAAFTGFRLVAREPGTWAVWAGAFFVFSLLLGVGMVAAIGPALTQMMQAQALGAAPDPSASLALMGRIFPFYGLILVLSLAGYAFMFAAVNRAVLRPGTGGPGRFAAGGDELRQLLVLVIVGAIFFAVYIAVVIVGVILAVVVGVAAGAAGGAAGSGANPLAVAGPAVLVMVALVFLMFLVLIWIMVRLSLASPMTFDLGRVEVFGSWRLTKGRFWAIFGAYFLATVVMFVIYLVALIAFAAIAAAIGGGLQAAGVAFKPDMTSVGAYLSPVMLVWIALASAIGALWMAVSIGAPAGVYAQLREVDLAATFGGAEPPLGTATGTVAPAADPTLPKFGR